MCFGKGSLDFQIHLPCGWCWELQPPMGNASRCKCISPYWYVYINTASPIRMVAHWILLALSSAELDFYPGPNYNPVSAPGPPACPNFTLPAQQTPSFFFTIEQARSESSLTGSANHFARQNWVLVLKCPKTPNKARRLKRQWNVLLAANNTVLKRQFYWAKS